MIAVTIGMGKYAELAVLAAARARQVTGLDTVVIDDAMAASHGHEHPMFVKLCLKSYVPADEWFLYFDADIVMLQHWNPKSHVEAASFTTVKDQFASQYVIDVDVPREAYFNSGLFIAHSQMHEYFFSLARLVWAMDFPNLDNADQSALNRAAMWLNLPVLLLDSKYNQQRYHLQDFGAGDVVNAHYTPRGYELAYAHLRELMYGEEV